MSAPTAAPAEPALLPGAPLQRVRRRGYYKDTATGQRYTSVTTILDRNVPKKALVPWSANTVARCAMDSLTYLTRSSRTDEGRIEAYDWLRAAADRKKDERADVGSAVHALIEHRILGTPVPAEFTEDPELAPFLARFEEFTRQWQVIFTASEMVVGNSTHLYAGTLDFLLSSPLIARRLGTDPAFEIAGDTKTGGELDVRGVYPEASLQMSAYAHAEFAQMRDGTRVAMPRLAPKGVVLHLRPEGFRLVPALVDDTVFAKFLAYRELDAEWTTGISKNVLGKPLTLTSETEKAAA